MRTTSLSAASIAAAACLLAVFAAAAAQPAPSQNYYVYACAESEDEVSLIRFGPGGTEEVKVIQVGSFPAEIEGPHGINISPDGKYWYVSMAHGHSTPYGTVHKYATGSDEWQGDVTLGLFPATLDVSAGTGLMFVVNFNLHGKMEPSTISVVETETMTEVARVPTGVMPHGSRLDPKGRLHYSVNMMDDDLVEVDALQFKVSRRLALSEHGGHSAANGHSGHHSQHLVSPTWVTTPNSQGKVYIAGNGANKIFEVDLEKWKIERTFSDTHKGPYNVAVTPDGATLVVTYKSADKVGFWDLKTGKEAAAIDTLKAVPHGLVISPDGEYAFVTVEGKGAEPGTVEVFHIPSRKRAGVAEMGKQAGGIAFWKMAP